MTELELMGEKAVVASIEAALNPAKTDYLFYLLASDNAHYFTNNYDDFLKKKQELGY